MLELKVTFDPATKQVAITGPIDEMPCTCVEILESAVKAVKQKAIAAELGGKVQLVKANGRIT